METYQQNYYAVKAERLRKKLLHRNFNVILCKNLNEAKKNALALINQQDVVAFGGSITIEKSGIIEALYDRKQTVINRELATDLNE